MQSGATLGPYTIERELGRGGMGTVFSARGPEGAVALKVIRPEFLASDDSVERFRREIRVGRTIDHPNVVRTLGGGEADGQHYLAMELVVGQTLRALLAEAERVPEELCRHIGREIAKGLAAIHAAGAIHRDVKPENVLITAEHVVKIMDLGVARVTDDVVRLSQTGAFVGSLHYAAPECFSSQLGPVDHRADLHALGLVLYELATGDAPYAANDVHGAIRRVIEQKPRRLGEVNPQLSPFYEELVHKLLLKDPLGRFATARDVGSVLEEGEDGPWWRARTRALRIETKRPLRRIRIPRETVVYGRDTELARLRDAFETAKSGAGRVVLIEGEAGIGKSRLVDELVARLHGDGEDFSFLFGSYPPSGAATAAGAWSTAYREELGPDGSAAHLLDNRVLVPAFDALLRGDTPPPGGEPLTKDALQTCFVRTTQSLAAVRPTVVLIDDLHFAPAEGRSLFAALAHAVAEHRIVLIGTLRPGVSGEWMAGVKRLEHATEIAVPRLGAKDLVELLGESLHSEHMAVELAGKIALKSDGNPFFVFEIVKSLRDGRYLTQSPDGSWVSTRTIDEIDIPPSVLELVNARVAALGEDERDLLDIAACAGFRFDPTLVGEAAGLTRIDALKRFGQIERRHRIVRSAGREMEFDHHQVQEALYGGLLEQLREEYHAAIGNVLETRERAGEKEADELDGALCVTLCEHFLCGGRSERGLRYLRRALDELEKAALLSDTITLAQRALAVPDLLSGKERLRLLRRLAFWLNMAGRREDERDVAEQALALAEETGDVLDRAVAHVSMSTSLNSAAEYEGALHHGREALRLARAADDRANVGHAARALGLAYHNIGDLEHALESNELSLAIAHEIGVPETEAAVSSNIGNVYLSLARLDDAEASFVRAIELAREAGHRRWEAAAVMNLGGVFNGRHQFTRALAQARQAYELSSAIGDRRGELAAITGIGITLSRLGSVEASRSAYERARALAVELGSMRAHGFALLGLGQVAEREGELDAAERHFVDTLGCLQEVRDRDLEAGARLGLVRVARRRGDVEAMREQLAHRDVFSAMAPTFVLAQCFRAVLDESERERALEVIRKHANAPETVMEAHHLMWQATRDPDHLREAYRQYESLRDAAPDEYRQDQTNQPIYRAVAADWAARVE